MLLSTKYQKPELRMDFLNIQRSQRSALEKVIGTSVQRTTGSARQWKLLVYDTYCKEAISPILSLQRLRQLGITLHLSLESHREPVPEVPVIYFMQPTEQNIMALKKDCERELYDEIYIHFAHRASQSVLQLLAKAMVEVGAVEMVKQVYDEFLGFVSLEENLFQLGVENSFVSYNLLSLTETQVMNYMETVSEGLVDVLTTLSILPIIRSPRDGPAALLAEILTKKLHELHHDQDFQQVFLLRNQTKTTKEMESLEELSLSSQRSVLLLTDRGLDLATMLTHTSGYQTLVDDILKIQSNRVVLPTPASTSEQKGSSNKVYPLDSNADLFWKQFAGRMIPEAVEHHSQELQKVSAEVSRIKRTTGVEDDADPNGMDSKPGNLVETVEFLPKLLEKKRLLETHLEIIKATMDAVSQRELYHFAEVEEKLQKGNFVNVQDLLEMLSKPSLLLLDKARLVAIYVLTPGSKTEDITKVLSALETQEAATPEDQVALRMVKYVKKLRALSARSVSELPKAETTARTGKLWKLADQAAQRIMEAQKQVKGLVYAESLSPMVQMLDLVTKPMLENKIDNAENGFLYYDPKLGSHVIPAAQRTQQQINSGILFVIGGGCYSEYQQLMSYCKADKSNVLQGINSSKKQVKKFIYGSTEMLNPKEFMDQAGACFVST